MASRKGVVFPSETKERQGERRSARIIQVMAHDSLNPSPLPPRLLHNTRYGMVDFRLQLCYLQESCQGTQWRETHYGAESDGGQA